MVFDRTYASYWVGPPTSAQTVSQGTDAFVNYCINAGQKLRSSGGRLYCVKVRRGNFKPRRVAAR